MYKNLFENLLDSSQYIFYNTIDINDLKMIVINRMKTVIYYLFLIPVLIFFFSFVIPLVIINENLFIKNKQMNKIFENWLEVKAEVAFFVLADNIYDYASLKQIERRVIDKVNIFEESFDYIFDEKNFKIIERKNMHIRSHRGILMEEWGKVQFEFVKIIAQGKGLSLYSKELFNMIHEKPLFERSLKDIIFIITYYSEKEYRNSFMLVLFLSISIIIFYIVFIRGRFLIKKVKTDEIETKEMSKFLMKIREIEREKIALDIHDVLIQKLKEIKTGIESVENNILPEIYNNIETGMFEAIQTARNISFALRPAEIDGDLSTSIKYYCAEVAWRNNIIINSIVSGFTDVTLDKDLETNIFRIVQEALANIVGHSKANIADVTILYSHPFVLITITDNGIGVPEDILKKLEKNQINLEHMGLQGIKDRVKLFDGVFSINSEINNGTIIRIKMPNKNTKEKRNA